MALLSNTEEGFCLVLLLLAVSIGPLMRVESHVIHIREASNNLESFPDFPPQFDDRYQSTVERPILSDEKLDNPETSKASMILTSKQKPANDTTLSIEDFAVSVLFKLKYYPFRKKVVQAARSASDAGSADGATSAARRLMANKGVVATGIDFGLPGGLGFGYGEQTPFRTFFSFSRISYALDQQ